MIAPPFRWKMMDVAFSDSISKPRRLIVGVSDKYESSRYDTISERGDHALKGPFQYIRISDVR